MDSIIKTIIRTAAAFAIGAAVCIAALPLATFAAESDEGSWKAIGRYKVTAYCPCRKCCGKWAGGPTASGSMPEAGRTVAAELPFGTHLLIDGEEYVVEDRGVNGAHIDMYMDSHTDAMDWGVKYFDIYQWEAE